MNLKHEQIDIGVNQLNEIIAKYYDARTCYTVEAVSGNTTIKLGAGRHFVLTVEIGREVTPDANSDKDKADEDS